jgi:hypothetical protein
VLNWNVAQLQTNDILANVEAKLGKKKQEGPVFEDIF